MEDQTFSAFQKLSRRKTRHKIDVWIDWEFKRAHLLQLCLQYLSFRLCFGPLGSTLASTNIGKTITTYFLHQPRSEIESSFTSRWNYATCCQSQVAKTDTCFCYSRRLLWPTRLILDSHNDCLHESVSAISEHKHKVMFGEGRPLASYAILDLSPHAHLKHLSVIRATPASMLGNNLHGFEWCSQPWGSESMLTLWT